MDGNFRHVLSFFFYGQKPNTTRSPEQELTLQSAMDPGG